MHSRGATSSIDSESSANQAVCGTGVPPMVFPRPAGNAERPRWSRLLAVAALIGLTGCGSQAGNLLYQTANAGSRTVVDLVITSYANVFAAGVASLQSLFGLT